MRLALQGMLGDSQDHPSYRNLEITVPIPSTAG